MRLLPQQRTPFSACPAVMQTSCHLLLPSVQTFWHKSPIWFLPLMLQKKREHSAAVSCHTKGQALWFAGDFKGAHSFLQPWPKTFLREAVCRRHRLGWLGRGGPTCLAPGAHRWWEARASSGPVLWVHRIQKFVVEAGCCQMKWLDEARWLGQSLALPTALNMTSSQIKWRYGCSSWSKTRGFDQLQSNPHAPLSHQQLSQQPDPQAAQKFLSGEPKSLGWQSFCLTRFGTSVGCTLCGGFWFPWDTQAFKDGMAGGVALLAQPNRGPNRHQGGVSSLMRLGESPPERVPLSDLQHETRCHCPQMHEGPSPHQDPGSTYKGYCSLLPWASPSTWSFVSSSLETWRESSACSWLWWEGPWGAFGQWGGPMWAVAGWLQLEVAWTQPHKHTGVGVLPAGFQEGSKAWRGQVLSSFGFFCCPLLLFKGKKLLQSPGTTSSEDHGDRHCVWSLRLQSILLHKAHPLFYDGLTSDGFFKLAELPRLRRWTSNWVIFVLGLSSTHGFCPESFLSLGFPPLMASVQPLLALPPS